MLNLIYSDENKKYEVTFKKITKNIVQILGDIPKKTCGFYLSRIGVEEKNDYTSYKTIYRVIDGGIQFSNDGTVYIPEPEPQPEPTYTLEQIKIEKINEMNMQQQIAIQEGISVTLSDGSEEHFTLTDHDQTSLMGLQTQAAQGAEKIPWHTSDTEEHCKYYSNEDMVLITTAAMAYVTYHVTYFRDLRIYINSLDDEKLVSAVTYGMYIPEEYQSEVLNDIYKEVG